ncbi:MAG: DUF2214 family protein [Pseudorhodoplanes sp.]|nr:DUF2214 family protein [Pseudorhodoplanes sp.]
MTTLMIFFHHLVAFTLAGALVVELTLLHQPLTLGNARRIIAADAVLSISIALLLVVGLLRVFYFEKTLDYYFSSYAFITKFSVFVAIAVLSSMPTATFLSWRKAVRAGNVPQVEEKRLRTIQATIHGELFGIVVILFCAAMMAKGGIV